MESQVSKKDSITFREVYIFDMEILQNIFYQNTPLNDENETSFGIPFLLAEKAGKIIAFASLVVDQNNLIDYQIYNDGSLTAENKTAYQDSISNFLKKKKSDNFNNPEQLKQSAEQIFQCLRF
ncbi:hypothetical protein ACWA1F_22620 [Flavobacterium sp. 3-218]